MSFTDLLLNLAALLLWLNWRSRHFDPLTRRTPATLVGTLRPAEPGRLKGWHLLGSLGCLLGVRAMLYWELGSPSNWTPRLDLGVIVLAFRSDNFRAVLVYSLLSFLRVLLVFYFWVLTLILINRSVTEADPIQKMLRLHLGRIARWPWPIQVLLPFVVITALWMALHPLLVYLGVLGSANSTASLVAQGLLLGVNLLLTLKYVLPVFLLLHLVASYIYFGNNPLWDFIATTARNLLAPLQRFPLRLAKVDFTPVVGALLLLLILHILPTYLLPRLFSRNLALSLWPQ
jgi:uncharacterized protein YggT (Ycf19 family)